jgi:excisionase family DNA binding protein
MASAPAATVTRSVTDKVALSVLQVKPILLQYHRSKRNESGNCPHTGGVSVTTTTQPDCQDQYDQLIAGGFKGAPEVAKFLGVSRGTIYSLMDDGTLPSVRIGKARRIPWNGVLQLVRRNLSNAPG